MNIQNIFEFFKQEEKMLQIKLNEDLFIKIAVKTYGGRYISSKSLIAILREEGFEQALSDKLFPQKIQLRAGEVYDSNSVFDYFTEVFSGKEQEESEENNMDSKEHITLLLEEFCKGLDPNKVNKIPKELMPFFSSVFSPENISGNIEKEKCLNMLIREFEKRNKFPKGSIIIL